ncbi:MAG: transmembrane 220 family protein [Pseudomonas sp.]
MKIANIVMGLLFVFSLIVQYNDPDPFRWMVVYGGAAVACFWALRGSVPRWLPGLVGLATLLWIGLWFPRVIGKVGFSEMFKEAGMATMAIEEGRELIGLLLVAIWMTVLFFRAGRRRSAPHGQAQV